MTESVATVLNERASLAWAPSRATLSQKPNSKKDDKLSDVAGGCWLGPEGGKRAGGDRAMASC